MSREALPNLRINERSSAGLRKRVPKRCILGLLGTVRNPGRGVSPAVRPYETFESLQQLLILDWLPSSATKTEVGGT